MFRTCQLWLDDRKLKGCSVHTGKPSSWRLPQREIKDLATCMRRIARVLWALHVILQEVGCPCNT